MIAIFLIVVTLILIVPYVVFKFISDEYYSCINYIGDFIVERLNMYKEMNKVSCFISNFIG